MIRNEDKGKYVAVEPEEEINYCESCFLEEIKQNPVEAYILGYG
jgi:hypothetical protein